MKKFLFFLLLFGFFYPYAQSQTATGCGNAIKNESLKPIKVGLVISTNDPETVWNALRLANFSLSEKDTVSIFLLGKGVEIRAITTKDYDIGAKLNDYLSNGGKIFACGTCMNSRNLQDSKECPISSLSDLYAIIRSCDKLLTF